jgi:DNA-binding NarL/FixJ family response regulator
MRAQRIFILSSHTLLARGMARLLQGWRGLRVVGTETDVDRGIQLIHALHPHVVILGSETGGAPSLALVSAVFEASPGIVVVALSVGDNLLHVYEDSQIKVARVEDLVQAIRQAGMSRARS